MNNQFKPILFSTPMVQAILDGRKTQTRRVCKHQFWSHSELVDVNTNKIFQKVDRNVSCPYGKVGDVLWVREKFRALVDCESGKFHSFSYYADMPEAFHKQFPHKWKPSIHMPKAACRLFLEITNVRVERLQDIGRQDALSEGIQDLVELEDTPQELQYYQFKFGGERFPSAVKAFAGLWSSINGADSWNANPWVWVIEFKRIEKPVNF